MKSYYPLHKAEAVLLMVRQGKSLWGGHGRGTDKIRCGADMGTSNGCFIITGGLLPNKRGDA